MGPRTGDDDSVVEQLDELVGVVLAAVSATLSRTRPSRADAGRAAPAARADTIIDSQVCLSWLAAVDSKQPARADCPRQPLVPRSW
jgi:hypothetical protein